MTINDALDVLKAELDRAQGSDLDSAYAATCEALRTINGLKQLIEDHKKYLEEALLYKSDDQWYNK